jgi:diadenosine tetraphosphate (Ap4A) HIT family hydrolase
MHMQGAFDEDCRSCLALRKVISLTISPQILETPYWVVEHVHPTSVRGWLVVVLTRHCSALHDLTRQEWDDLNRLLPAICQTLHEILGTEKEYVMQLAEGVGFKHVHFHVVARLPEWPDDLRGSRVFSALGDGVENPLTADELTPLALEIREQLLAILGQD